ncbi:Aste57867_5579 [Aphanomyces stellatus]|uniref:Aste57867_5579 protein n=1 Tax=Aphanomyces stellatus TaxID=120398 RepID=A0A485KGQ0_9STRA|nr:hypothetical protein As57867_005566 [Aphanomyces stellatus]VFT82625.1 Aste57867_5579 [Aphanomyces stellatus]
MAEEEEVIWDWQPAAIALVEEDAAGQIKLTAEGVSLLSGYDYPVAVVCLAGCEGRLRVFEGLAGCEPNSLPGVPPQTQGIYFLGSADFMRSGRCLIVLNLHVDLQRDTANASAIWDVALVLSSLVVYAHDGMLSNPTARITDTLDVIHSLQADCSTEELKALLPSFLWVTNAASPVATAAADFKAFAWPFELPQSAFDLSKLDHIGWYRHGPPSAAVATCRDRVLHGARVKTMFGTDLTGEMLLALVDGTLSNLHHDGRAMDLLGAWNHVVSLKCDALAAAAMATYQDVMGDSVTEVPPMELDMFDKLHADVAQVATSMYSSQARFKKAPARRTHKLKLSNQLVDAYVAQRAALRAHSETYCRAVAATHLVACVETDDTSSSFSEMVARFVDAYRAAARGPAADHVLASVVVADVVACFGQREAAAKAAWTDAKLGDERTALQAAYEAKQAALVAHFQQEAAQLRETVAAEQRMWTMAQAAKQSRDNIDSHEARRAADELAAAQATMLALEERERKAHAAAAAAHTQTERVEAQMAQLRETMASEAAARAALVESLAESIRNEKRLEASLANDESATAAATADLTKQLRTLGEEKMMLQMQLNDVLLKVSALPASLQAHVLSHNIDATIEFGDALSSYMAS